jgi:hypothetical protein
MALDTVFVTLLVLKIQRWLQAKTCYRSHRALLFLYNDSIRTSVRTDTSPPLAIMSSLPLVRNLPKKNKILHRALSRSCQPLSRCLVTCGRLHRTAVLTAAGPLANAASTDLSSLGCLHMMDSPASRWGGELRVKPSRRAPYAAVNLRAGVELHNDKAPFVRPSNKMTLRWKLMLQEYVSSASDVSYGCCKCFILML